jgi:membrane-bound lytic murein transglycosylase A
MKRILLPFILTLFLVACVKPPVTKPEDALAPVSWGNAATLNDDLAFKDIAAAARQSLEYYKKIPPETTFFFGPDKASALDMIVTLQNFLLIVENDTLTFAQKLDQVKNNFVLYRSVGSNGEGRVLFTGYYEPMLSCRPRADDAFRYPLYRRPDDLVEVDLALFGDNFPKNKLIGRLDDKKVIPYFTREEIDQQHALAGDNLEILWCSDLIDIYVLQVQGSGKADLGDGKVVSVLYDGQNGRQYKSIGKYLIDTGAMTKENMSMQAIREYLRQHPDKLADVLDQNPSYVFFRLDSGASLGNIGVALTPGRSIATDSKLMPKGALGFIVSQKPVIENGAIKAWTPFTRFVVNQDTGGAIKGPGRVDLFWGPGQEAELGAGNMQHEGELYFLLRKK